MKRVFIITAIFAVMFLLGCEAAGLNKKKKPGKDISVWDAEDIPVSLKYDRRWMYQASAETDDEELLKKLCEALKSLEITEETDKATEDFSDILIFDLQNGDKLTLEFEADVWIAEDGTRYTVKGLDEVREILDSLIPVEE